MPKTLIAVRDFPEPSRKDGPVERKIVAAGKTYEAPTAKIAEWLIENGKAREPKAGELESLRKAAEEQRIHSEKPSVEDKTGNVQEQPAEESPASKK